MKKLNTYITSAVAAAGGMIAPYAALAQSNPPPFQTAANFAANVGTVAGVKGSSDLPTIVGNVINILLGFLGILFLVLLLWAGFEWMTAGGDEKKVETATKRIRNAVIGLVVIVAAFAISNFVLTSLIKVAGQ
jgi:hypothetical protein